MNIFMRLESSTAGDTDCDTVLDTAMLQQTYIIWALGPLGVTAFQHFDRSGCKLLQVTLYCRLCMCISFNTTTQSHTGTCQSVHSCSKLCSMWCLCFYLHQRHRRKDIHSRDWSIRRTSGIPGYHRLVAWLLSGTIVLMCLLWLGLPCVVVWYILFKQCCDNFSFFTTGRPGWGIAWYIDGLLIPQLTLTRGQNYTFRVFGGDVDNIFNRATYHPFYITDSLSGGRLLNTQAEKMV